VNTKETALITAATTYQNGYLAALSAKKTWILAAWDKTTKKDIKLVLVAASKTYKTSLNTLKKALRTSQKTANSTYKTAVKTCKWTGLWDLVEVNDSDIE
jgi:hypothetical protein